MFSKHTKFLKKNILLIGIVLFVIIIVAYFVFINYKEGFDGPDPKKAQLIPVSTIEKFYNALPDQNTKNVVAPIVELYKLFVANYADAVEVSLQIIASQKDSADTLAAAAKIPLPPDPSIAFNAEISALQSQRRELQRQLQMIDKSRNGYSAAENQRVELESQKIVPKFVPLDEQINKLYREKPAYSMAISPVDTARAALKQKWDSIINPGIQKVLINAIKWLPTAKRFYDNFASNNYYGLMGHTITQLEGGSTGSMPNYNTLLLTLIPILMNTLWNEDQLSIVLGPAFAKSNPTPPIPMPVTKEQLIAGAPNTTPEIMLSMFSKVTEYMTNLGKPFIIIQEYLIESVGRDLRNMDENNVKSFVQNNPIPNAIIQLIEQLNNALANDVTDQTTIGQLTTTNGQLTGKLNAALANDETDKTTITNLQAEVADLTTKQSNSIGSGLMPVWSVSSTSTSKSTDPVYTTAATSSSPAAWSLWTTPATTSTTAATSSKSTAPVSTTAATSSKSTAWSPWTTPATTSTTAASTSKSTAPVSTTAATSSSPTAWSPWTTPATTSAPKATIATTSAPKATIATSTDTKAPPPPPPPTSIWGSIFG